MTLITTDHEIKNELAKVGYSIITASEISFSSNLNKQKQAFIGDWEKLELDEYMKDGGKYRQRRYGRFMLNTTTDSLVPERDVTYFQPEELNPENGGIDRKFAPLLEETVHNKFLTELIRFDYSQLPDKKTAGIEKWKVGVHQIRIIAQAGKQGLPAPEGIHKDGEMFTVQHLIRRQNIEGGENSAYDNDKNVIHTWLQESQFDSYYFEDDAIWHSVTGITAKDKSCPGYRDVLLIDFDPIEN